MREIKKLGFGLMRLPQKSANGADIDMEQFKKMVDLFLERGVTHFDTSTAISIPRKSKPVTCSTT